MDSAVISKKKNKENQSLDSLKIPPHSKEAEQSVLGGLMLDGSAWDQIADRVTAEDFYAPEHKILFTILASLAKADKPFDVITVSESLKMHGQLEEAGGENYLFEIARNTPTVANIVAYAEIVHERAILRRLLNISSSISQMAYMPEGRDAASILDEAEQQIFAIAESGQDDSGPQSIDDLTVQVIHKIEELRQNEGALTGISTGFADLDEMTAGLQRGDLVIVAGRPSMGKTTFSMNIAENVALNKVGPVLVFSMEMPADSLVMRMVSSLSRVDQYKVRTGNVSEKDWPRLASTASMLKETQVFIDDTAALSPSDMRARARRVARQHGNLSLIVVDYLQLMKVPGYGQNRTLEISEISRSLKALAKELDCPVIALSQLNRSLEQRQDRRPVMSDLRESGSIEQDADVIAFIYRDEVYNENSPDQGVAEVIISKQRNGPIGKVRLAFLGQYTRFENLAMEASFSQH